MKQTAAPTYHPFSQLQHWLMAGIWISVWLFGFVAVHLRDQWNAHHELTFIHKAIGSTVLFLTALRIVWRLTHPTPPLPASMSPTMQRAAHFAHYALYAMALVALPLSGWMWSSSAGKQIMMLGLFELPPLFAPSDELRPWIGLVHRWLSWVFGAAVLGHAVVAFKHHFIDRDNVLKSMLPAWLRGKR